MVLQELFTSKPSYKVLKDNKEHIEWVAEIGGRTISIDADYCEDSNVAAYWEVMFAEIINGANSYRMTGNGSAPQVIALVKEFIIDLVSRPDVKTIMFSAEGDSRISAYKAMLKRLVPIGWRADSTGLSSGKTIFKIRKNETT